MDDRVTADFRVPQEPSRLCYFAIPATLIGWYRDFVFPEVESVGLVPVTARDVLSPPGALSAKIDTLLDRAALVIAEVGDSYSAYEASLALARKSRSSVLIIASGLDVERPAEFRDARILMRPADFDADPDRFVAQLQEWLQGVATAKSIDVTEPIRLLATGEHSAALISAVSALEVSLSEHFGAEKMNGSRSMSLRSMLRAAEERGMFLSQGERGTIEEATHLRNETIHRRTAVTPKDARRLVTAITGFVKRIG